MNGVLIKGLLVMLAVVVAVVEDVAVVVDAAVVAGFGLVVFVVPVGPVVFPLSHGASSDAFHYILRTLC